MALYQPLTFPNAASAQCSDNHYPIIQVFNQTPPCLRSPDPYFTPPNTRHLSPPLTECWKEPYLVWEMPVPFGHSSTRMHFWRDTQAFKIFLLLTFFPSFLLVLS